MSNATPTRLLALSDHVSCITANTIFDEKLNLQKKNKIQYKAELQNQRS